MDCGSVKQTGTCGIPRRIISEDCWMLFGRGTVAPKTSLILLAKEATKWLLKKRLRLGHTSEDNGILDVSGHEDNLY